MKKIALIIFIILLFYTRFVNLDWGLPYPMHPDERNMAVAVQSLNCNFKFQISNFKLSECLNPHFFAYGQLPLYLAYGGIQAYHVLFGLSGQITPNEATLALRTISSLSSILLVFVMLKIVGLLNPKKGLYKLYDFTNFITLVFFIFQPYMIQFSHFGTTESLLMLFYVLIIYFSLKLVTNHYSLATLFLLGIFSGLALGTKTSSILFLGIPIIAVLIKGLTGGTIEGSPKRTEKVLASRLPAAFEYFLGSINRDGICQCVIYFFISLFFYFFICILFFLLSSPQSFFNWKDFVNSMNYESAVGLGTFLPFYTRQFAGTTPLLFQFTRILPYVLGWPQLILGILGFIFLPSYMGEGLKTFFLHILQVARVRGPRRRAQSASQQAIAALEHRWGIVRVTESAKLFDIFRFALLISFLPPSFFFAKWTRFIAPSFPLFSLFAILFLLYYAKKYSINIKVIIIIIGISVIPGISFLSIYLSSDVRFTASEWIYNNIPANSKILSETANVIDLPIPTNHYPLGTSRYLVNSFNFYDLDANPLIQSDLTEALNDTDYIVIPSRRIFKNHNSPHYQLLTTYYSNLFSGASGFEKVAEFSSFPTLSFNLSAFSFTLPFPDEDAEETWTVFDHPVIRIYKKIQVPSFAEASKGKPNSKKISGQLDFSNYKTVNYQLPTSHYPLATSHSLLVADTPEKWERGLMYVKNKQDIGGRDGMIFIFPDSQKRSFWNKNTLSHLTLYWVNNQKVIGISDLPSITESKIVTTVSSPSSSDTVIEIIK